MENLIIVTYGRECPATSALSLILDWGDITLGPPINGCWRGRRLTSLPLLGHRSIDGIHARSSLKGGHEVFLTNCGHACESVGETVPDFANLTGKIRLQIGKDAGIRQFSDEIRTVAVILGEQIIS